MTLSTSERITKLFWIGGGSCGVWFYTEAHWTLRAALIGVYVMALLVAYGVSDMIAEHVERVEDSVDHRTSGLEYEIQRLESELEKSKSRSIELESRLEELEAGLAALTSETRMAYAAIRISRQ